MFELIARLAFAGGTLAASLLTGTPHLELAWRAAAFVACYAIVLELMGRRGMRNPGISGWAAVLDSAAIAFLLAQSGEITRFGFVTLVPLAWAVARHSANSVAMAPIVAALLLVGDNLFGSAQPGPALMAQALVILVIGLLIPSVRTQMPATAMTVATDEPQPDTQRETVELRDRLRDARQTVRQVELQARRDHAAAALMEAGQVQPDTALVALAKQTLEYTGAEGLTIHTLDSTGERLVLAAATGDLPQGVEDAAIDVPLRASDAQVKSRAEGQAGSETRCSTLLLRPRGKLLGTATLFQSNLALLEDAVKRAEELVDPLASLVKDQMDRKESARRLAEVELLYAVASISTGAETAPDLADRIVRELWDVVGADHLSVWLADDETLSMASSKGAELCILPLMDGGADGWLAEGAREVAMPDARKDSRVDEREALLKRIGSFVAIPIRTETEVLGVITAATHRAGGLDQPQIETLRVVAAETSLAMTRMRAGEMPLGLATPKEFKGLLARAKGGSLVYLQVLRRDDLIASHGKCSVALACGRWVQRIRTKLPAGGALCRRDEGDFVAYLPGADEERAAGWAAEAITAASMTPLTTADGRSRIPLAVRSKVAGLGKQMNQFSDQKAAS